MRLKYALTAAVTIIVIAVAIGFFRQEQTVRDLKGEIKARNAQDCTTRTEARDGLRNVLIFALGLGDPTTPGAIAFRRYVDENLPPLTCKDPKALPVPVSG